MEKTTAQRISEIERKVDEMERIVRVGTVATVNAENRTARVSWENWDEGVRSGELHVLENGTGWMPTVGQRVVSLHRPGDNGAGFILGAVV